MSESRSGYLETTNVFGNARPYWVGTTKMSNLSEHLSIKSCHPQFSFIYSCSRREIGQYPISRFLEDDGKADL